MILSQIKKVKSLDKNSQECIDELHYLNTLTAESEEDLPQVKHLPTTLFDTLTAMENEVKQLILQEDMREDYGSGYFYGCTC